MSFCSYLPRWLLAPRCVSVRLVNFLKRNLNDYLPNVEKSAHLAMIRPHMEYASIIWDPYCSSDRNKFNPALLLDGWL